MDDCRFCYCPLYPCEKNYRGGKFIKNKSGKEIWDCSSCNRLHQKEVVNRFLNFLRERKVKMKKENVKKLKKEFPELLKKFGLDRDGKTMYCGDGWYRLLHNTLEKINYIRQSVLNFNLFVTCIKEKFGMLRVYVDYDGRPSFGKAEIWMDIIQSIAEDVAELSSTICEKCGVETGGMFLTKIGGYKTLCDDCAKQAEGFYFKDGEEK